MREILFRGKTEKGEWILGGYAKCNNREYILPDIDLVGREWVFKNIEVIPETVGQYIGIDANGKKIFEGDIVKATYDCECEKTYQVIFFNGGYKMKANDCHTVYDYSIHEEHPDFKVIGNITDNPELLEVQNEHKPKM